MKLLYDAHLAFNKIITSKLFKYGLKPGNQRILFYVSNHPGCLQRDIAENCDVDPSTLSTVLSNLEKKGFIERRRFEKNNRSTAIYITKEGKKLSDTATEFLLATSKIALSGFSDKEADELRDYLTRIIDNLKNASKDA